MDPGIKRATGVEAFNREIDLYESLLGNLLGIFAISEDSIGQAIHLGLVLVDQFPKRHLVSALQLLN
jgi:hypothetical protein